MEKEKERLLEEVDTESKQKENLRRIRGVLNDKEELIRCAKNCFQRVDTDNSQFIQLDEMGALMRQMANFVNVRAPSDKQVKRCFRFFDANNDGMICFDEFLIIFKSILEFQVEQSAI